MLKPVFSVRRFGERYDRAEVDAFVARILATVGRTNAVPVLTVQDLRGAAFRTPMFGPGYSAREVDDFLTEAEEWMPDRPAAGHFQPGAVRREAPLFTPVRLREGYDVVEVDEFIDRLLATVNGQPVKRPVTVREIRKVQFTPVRVREGYDVEEVDAFLDEAEGWLSGR